RSPNPGSSVPRGCTTSSQPTDDAPRATVSSNSKDPAACCGSSAPTPTPRRSSRPGAPGAPHTFTRPSSKGVSPMHVPDHFLPMGATAPAAAIATGAVVLAATAGRPRITTRDTLLAGTTAAMIFGAQMVNYPIAGGVSGHLFGGALATALLGPRLALLAMTAVVGVQALLFGDGGINALGVNVL